MAGRRRASIVFPVPGGPAKRTLWRPAATISSARRPRSCPRTSARSGQDPFRAGSARVAAGRLEATLEVSPGFGEVAERHRLDPGERRLRGRLMRAEKPGEAGALRGLRGDDCARDRPQSPVERQLPDRRVFGQAPGRYLMRRGEDREGDGKVVAGALLAQSGGRKVDRDPPKWPFELGARDPRADPLLRFLARLVGQANDGKRRHPTLQVGLDLDRPGLQPDQGMREGARKHATEARETRRAGEPRLRREFVSTERLIERCANDAPAPDGHGLEADVQAVQLRSKRQPSLGRPPDPPGLFRAHGLEGVAELRAAASLHLTDDDGPAAADDDVELVTADPGVGGEDAVAAQPVVAAYAPLRLRPEPP